MRPAARVVPDVGSFAVDDGFWYLVPEHMTSQLRVGSLVRVPLSGRRVRGWVIEIADREAEGLKQVDALSTPGPLFGEAHLRGLRWAAHHYVAPVAALLGRATPPNLPRSSARPAEPSALEGGDHPLGELARRAAAGRSMPVTALVAGWHHLEWVGALAPVLHAGGSALVVAASAAEVERVATAATRVFGDVVAEVRSEDDAADTSAWEAAQSPPRLVVGTPKTAAWKVEGLALAVVLEESRRAMKDRQTPTIHVRDLMRTRSRLEGFNLVFFGPTPGVELLAAGAEVVRAHTRAWGLVEVVDRSEDAPGSGFLSPRTMAAITATAEKGGRVFVFTHRRVAAASLRCIRCRLVRSCDSCGLPLGRVDSCPRCATGAGVCSHCGGAEFEEMGTVPQRLVTEINRRAGAPLASVHPGEGAVSVGTERDLADLAELTLAVAADMDGLLTRIGYRTSEEALRLLGRLGSVVSRRSGSRLILQTSHPDADLVATMRRGDPIPYLERVLVERARHRLPPSVEMMVVEVRGEIPESAAEDLTGLGEEVSVMGPMRVDGGLRWLLAGRLDEARVVLRRVVARWRDKGATVRVDVDPIDI